MDLRLIKEDYDNNGYQNPDNGKNISHFHGAQIFMKHS
ncbi:MAG: hypothetical protein RI909_604, partial [Bacteroidota bacterium]